MGNELVISVRELKKHYGEAHALDGVSLDLIKGGQYAIRGASGSGKSTLLYLLGGLERPTAGKIFVEGRDLFSLNDEELANYRNSFVGFIFQFHFLLPTLKALDNVLLPARIGGKFTKDLLDRTYDLAKILQVESCLKKFPYQLSGGEQQRINIIRAILLSPKLLLCDEPTGNLDSKNAELVAYLLKKMALDHNITLAVVTHDQNISNKFDNHFFIQDGVLTDI